MPRVARGARKCAILTSFARFARAPDCRMQHAPLGIARARAARHVCHNQTSIRFNPAGWAPSTRSIRSGTTVQDCCRLESGPRKRADLSTAWAVASPKAGPRVDILSITLNELSETLCVLFRDRARSAADGHRAENVALSNKTTLKNRTFRQISGRRTRV